MLALCLYQMLPLERSGSRGFVELGRIWVGPIGQGSLGLTHDRVDGNEGGSAFGSSSSCTDVETQEDRTVALSTAAMFASALRRADAR